MIAEIGHFALIVSLSLAILLSVLPVVGASRNNTLLMNTARPLSWGMFFSCRSRLWFCCGRSISMILQCNMWQVTPIVSCLGTIASLLYGAPMKVHYCFGCLSKRLGQWLSRVLALVCHKNR